jgi:hypothetical protein
MNDFLDFIGYMSRTTKTIRELAGTADNYASKGEDFLNRIAKHFKNRKRVQNQCKRLLKQIGER